MEDRAWGGAGKEVLEEVKKKPDPSEGLGTG